MLEREIKVKSIIFRGMGEMTARLSASVEGPIERTGWFYMSRHRSNRKDKLENITPLLFKKHHCDKYMILLLCEI